MDNISLYLPGILLAYSAFLLGIASPGPNVLAVIGTSMEVGRKSGMALASGVALGSLCWALLTVVGLSALLSAYAFALTIIKVGGGLYLLWLAYKSFKAARSKHDIDASAIAGGKRSLFGYALRGFIVQMTNPKAALAWIEQLRALISRERWQSNTGHYDQAKQDKTASHGASFLALSNIISSAKPGPIAQSSP